MTPTDNGRFRQGLLVPILLIAVLIGAGFRCWAITSKPLWLDEGYSAYAAAKGFAFLWQVVPLYETHPPFYYSLLRAWSLMFGDDLLGLRSLGIICGLLTLAAAGAAAREIAVKCDLDKSSRSAFIAIAVSLAALSPQLVEMSREVRPYPVLILVYTCAIAAIFRLSWRMDRGSRMGGPSFYFYLAMLELTFWLHNLGALFAVPLCLALLVLCFRRDWSKEEWIGFLLGHIVAILAWLPALMLLADQAPTWISSTWLHFPPAGLMTRITALFIVPTFLSIVAGLLLLIFASIAATRTANAGRSLLALLLLAGLPLALSLGISALIAPVFIIRIMTPVTIAGILLLASGATLSRKRFSLPVMGCVTIVLGAMAITDVQYRKTTAGEKWYAAVNWLAARYRPGDMVYAYPNEGALPFDRATRDRSLAIRTRPIPGAVPVLAPPPGSHYVSGSRGVPSLDQAHLRAIVEEPISRQIPTIWLLRLGPWAYDKQDIFLKELLRNRVRIARFTKGPIDIIGLRRKNLAPAHVPEAAAPLR